MSNSVIIINEHYEGLNPVSFGQEHCAPGHNYGPAVRTHWLLHYVISGYGTFVEKGTYHDVGPGDTFVIAPYEETYYEADKCAPWHYIWIGFTGSLPKPLDVPVLHIPALGEIFMEARKCRDMSSGRSAYLSGKLWELFSCLLDSEQTEYDYVSQAVHCMKLEYANGIGIAEIAQRLNLNRSYLSSLFKERMAVSPQTYLTNLRTEKAIELMVKYKKSPSVAAISTGYSDVYQFSRMFKRHTGYAPREYIRLYPHIEKRLSVQYNQKPV